MTMTSFAITLRV